MKKILISLFILSFGALAKLNAQCTISRVAVEIVSFNSSTCQVVFNLSWQQEVNNGNKFAYIHLWTAANYHTPAAAWTNIYSSPPKAPKAPELVNSLGTISLINDGSGVPSIGTTYPADLSVTPLGGALTVTETSLSGSSERITVKNISVTIPGGCTGALPIRADVWASQAANGKLVHCASEGLSFDLKNPTLTGIKVCNPRSVSFSITNTGSSSITVHYVLYADNGDAIFNPDGVGFDSLLTAGADVTLAAGASLTQVQLAYPGANGVTAEKSIWLEAVVTGETATTVKLLADPGCATLPVSFRSFAAKRNHSTVELRWVSANEINNSGFEVQRQIGTGSWQTVAFVPTQAVGGNSSTDLSYAYNDPNITKGISNYRVRQVDFDGKYKYSEVRSVRGESQLSKTIIYPNPSFDGKINVVFDDQNSIRDVSLMDINGRIMKQWKGISTNNIQIDNLAPGLYNLRIVITSTGEQSTEKIVVNKR